MKLLDGEKFGTFFIPKGEKLASRKSWIAFTVKPKGVIRVDDGAAQAVLKKGKSLLPIGIVEVKGDFGVGAPVDVISNSGLKLGTGLVNYNSGDIRKIIGINSGRIKKVLGSKPYDEVIHRDNLVINKDE
jgi:glutamate 5-kinase